MSKKHIELILFFTWSLWISLEFLLGPFSHVRIHDAGDSLLPQLIASKIQFQKYGLSYFADYMASGVDAASQFLVPFSNLNSLLFITLPPYLAYGVLMFVQRFLASYFTYRLARESLRLNIFPSIIAALLFSLFNFSIYSFTLYHALGLPALPFIIWSLERVLRTNSPKIYLYLIVLGIFVGFSNYFVYFSPYLLPFIFFWFIYVKNTYSPKIIFNLIIFSLSTAMPMIPNLLSTFYNAQSSQRTIWNLESSTFYPQGKYFSAFFRVSSILKSYWPSLVIIILSFLMAKSKEVIPKKFLKVALFLIFISFAYKLSQPLFSHFPSIARSFSFDRFEIIIPFVLSFGAATVLNQLPKSRNRIVFAVAISLIAIFSLKIKIETLKNYAPYRNLYQHPDLVELSKNIDSSKWRVATITGGGARPSYALANGLSTVDTYLTIYPKTYHKFWGEVIKDRIKDDKERYSDFIDWGNRIYLYGPNDFDSSDKINFRKYYDLDLLSQANVKYIISTKPVDDPNLFLLPSKYRQDSQNWQNFKLSEKFRYFLSGKFYGRPLYIYENKVAYPRFFLEKQNIIVDGQVEVKNYSPDKIELVVFSREDSKLIFSTNYYPYWFFMINGASISPQRYKETFMSINLPQGQSEITIAYEPFYKIF